MTSESTNRFSDETMRKQSSLFVRTRPTSVTPPLAIRTHTPVAAANYTPAGAWANGPAPKLAEHQGPRKPLNPTDYSLLGHSLGALQIRFFQQLTQSLTKSP